MNYEVVLSGCTPVPLAHYLKALGILRLVSEQTDSGATCSWQEDTFRFGSTLDREGLIQFFLQKYQPTPIIAPWNAGSGFYYREGKSKEKDALTGKLIKTGVRNQPTAATQIVDTIAQSKASRFKAYRHNIGKTKVLLEGLGHKEAPGDEQKVELVTQLRNVVDDKTLAGIDAALFLTTTAKSPLKFPPLLGTGWNDGAADFTSNFMQRLTDVFDPVTGEPLPPALDWLQQAFFAENIRTAVNKAAIGQFSPGAAGGANSTSGFIGASFVNPWDYILMIEGALLFAAASTRKLESAEPGVLMYPFCVRQAGVGYGSASLADEAASRSEMWLPLWKRPVTLAELSAIFGEGRAQVGGRAARNGVDFARAVVTLGVDRGIDAFQRYGFQVRNGLAYFATPLERVAVTRNPRADLLADLDQQGWLDRFRSRAKADDAPASATRAILELDARILDLCRNKDAANVRRVLVALGRGEAAMARSPKWSQPAPPSPVLRPVPLLRPDWLAAAGEDSPTEFRLAAALASITGKYGQRWLPLRCHLEPVEPGGSLEKPFFQWAKNPGNDVVWHEGDPVAAMNAVFARRLLRAEQAGEGRNLPDYSRVPVSLDDVAAFIAGETDDELLADLIQGLSLLDWSKVQPEHRPPLPEKDAAIAPSAFYALLKLCFQRSPLGERAIPLVPGIHRRAMDEDGLTASRLAARRLRASGFPPAVEEIPVSGEIVRRSAAALLFPLTSWQLGRLRLAVLRLERETDFTPLDPATVTFNYNLT